MQLANYIQGLGMAQLRRALQERLEAFPTITLATANEGGSRQSAARETVEIPVSAEATVHWEWTCDKGTAAMQVEFVPTCVPGAAASSVEVLSEQEQSADVEHNAPEVEPRTGAFVCPAGHGGKLLLRWRVIAAPPPSGGWLGMGKPSPIVVHVCWYEDR